MLYYVIVCAAEMHICHLDSGTSFIRNDDDVLACPHVTTTSLQHKQPSQGPLGIGTTSTIKRRWCLAVEAARSFIQVNHCFPPAHHIIKFSRLPTLTSQAQHVNLHQLLFPFLRGSAC